MKLHDTSKTADFNIKIEVNLEQKHCNNVQLHEICDKIQDRKVWAWKKFWNPYWKKTNDTDLSEIISARRTGIYM